MHYSVWPAATAALNSLIEPIHSLRIVSLISLYQCQIGKQFMDASIWKFNNVGEKGFCLRCMLFYGTTDGGLAL